MPPSLHTNDKIEKSIKGQAEASMIEGSGVGLNTKIPDDLHFCPLLLLLLHLFQSGSWVKIVSSKIQIQIQTWNWKPAHSVPSLINTPCKGCMCMNLRTMKWNVGRYHPIFDICLCCTSIPNVRGQPPKQTCLHFMIAWPQLVHQPCDWISAMFLVHCSLVNVLFVTGYERPNV